MQVKNINIEEIVIQKEEVESVKWASIDEIEKLTAKKEFSESHTKFFEECMKFIEK